jgi:hypothetical protein
MIGIVVTIIILSLVGNVYFGYKYFRFKKLTKEFDIGTGRVGFYKYSSGGGSYRAIVYVKELDKYTDGYSLLKIDRVEATGSDKNTSRQWATDNFISLRLTSEIEWLESVDQIKRLRKEKLLKIKKL